MKKNNFIILAYNKGYRVSKSGDLVNPNGNIIKGCVVTQNGYSYKRFTLRNGKDCATISVHRLQAFQKFGEKIFEPGIVVRHLNNNSLDNSWDNIDIGTVQDNHNDNDKDVIRFIMKEVGLYNRKYEYEDVIKMRESGMSYQDIADLFSTSKSQIYYICNRKVYSNHGKKFDKPIIIK